MGNKEKVYLVEAHSSTSEDSRSYEWLDISKAKQMQQSGNSPGAV